MTHCPSRRLRFATRTRAQIALERLRRHDATAHLRHELAPCPDCNGYHLIATTERNP